MKEYILIVQLTYISLSQLICSIGSIFNQYTYYCYYYYYLLQLNIHSVAIVLALVTNNNNKYA